MKKIFKIFKLISKNYSQSISKNFKAPSKILIFSNVYEDKLCELNRNLYFISKKHNSTYSMKDAMTVDKLRTKMVIEPIYPTKQNLRRSILNSHYSKIKEFYKVKEKDEILTVVLPEFFKMIFSVKYVKLKQPEFLHFSIHLFNIFSETDFPIMLAPYFVNILDQQDSFFKDLKSLDIKKFESNFESCFLEKAPVFYLDELAMLSLIPSNFQVSKKIISTLENSIIHKLEFEGALDDMSFILIKLWKSIKFYSPEYRSKIIEKTLYIINEKGIDNTALIELIYIMSFVAYSDTEKNSAFEKFFISIRKIIFEIPLDSPKLIIALFRLITSRKLGYIFQKSGQNEFIYVLIDTFISKINSFSSYQLSDILYCISYIKNIDQSTKNKIYISFLGVMPKINRWSTLLNFQKLMYRNDSEFAYIIELRAIELMLSNTHPDRYFNRLIERMNTKGLLFEQIYLNFIKNNEKSSNQTKDESSSEENEQD